MRAFISKQPNGLYCRFSTAAYCPTDWNMTEEEYIEMCAEQAREEAREELAKYVKPFEWVEDYFITINMSQIEFDNFLRETSEPVKQKETIEVDSLVHCKDCGYYRNAKGFCMGLPTEPPVVRNPDDFCSRGRRK